jgi:hypothetical protein
MRGGEGAREAKPLSLDGTEVGERVFAKYSPYLVAGSTKGARFALFSISKR